MSQGDEMRKIIPWFHGDLTRHASEVLLMNNGEEGSYLLREVTSREYCVSVRGKSDVRHFKMDFDGSIYRFGIQEFNSISSIASYFANQPLIGTKGATMGSNFEQGTLYTLKHPYPFEVPEPDGFDEIRMQSTVSENADVSSLRRRLKATPVATKSGYLTKQGGKVKTWKRRWFACEGNKLSYYEDRNNEKPISTIDLREARSCYKSEQPGLRNCFTLDCRERTWHFSADCDEDAADWMRLINWKLNCNRP